MVKKNIHASRRSNFISITFSLSLNIFVYPLFSSVICIIVQNQHDHIGCWHRFYVTLFLNDSNRAFGCTLPNSTVFASFLYLSFAQTKKEPAPESGPNLAIINELLQYHPQGGQCNPDYKSGNSTVNPNPLQILSYLILNQGDQ